MRGRLLLWKEWRWRPGQGDMGTSGKAGEVSVYLLPMSMILARQRWSVSVCVPPPTRWHREQNRSTLSAAEFHHICSTSSSLGRGAQTTPTAGVQLFFFLFHIKRSWILVTVETSSPNCKEFDSLHVKSYNFSFSLKKREIRHIIK